MIYPLGSGFFGLTPEDKLNIYSLIHEIVFHGKGGYTWSEVYNMPIWLRRFTFQKIKAFYEKENEQNEQALRKAKSSSKRQPNYRTRASNK